MYTYWIIFGFFMLLSWIVGNQMKTRIRKYSRIPTAYGMTGRDIAEKMLRDSGIDNVQVISTPGELTDHYNPAKRTVNLSRDIYHGNSIAAAAVAAHECGHAIQHAKAYAPLKFRSAMVPVVSFASRYVMWVLLAGILMIETFPSLMLVGIILFGLTTLFSLVTLPVEINASQRALAWLNNSGVTTYQTHPQAQDALKWAAYTYVVAALASLATLMYYVMIFLGSRD